MVASRRAASVEDGSRMRRWGERRGSDEEGGFQ